MGKRRPSGDGMVRKRDDGRWEGRENAAFLRFLTRIKDRQHRYYACPKCRQTVRVPRGRGKINIRCPKCGEQFVKKT